MSARLSHYVDFYALQALKYKVSKFSEFDRAGMLLSADVDKTLDKFLPQFAGAIFDYSFRAVIEEADDFADGRCDVRLDEDGLYYHYERLSVPETLDVLLEIYSHEWAGSYGGEAWADIVRAQINFVDGTWDCATYIDHCADLEHNGGCYFNKYMPRMKRDFYSDLMSFLTWKFRADVIDEMTEVEYAKKLSWKVRDLINRYYRITRTDKFLPDFLDFIDYEPIDYSHNTHYPEMIESGGIGVECWFCENHCDENDVIISNEGFPYCPGCYNELFTSCDCCGDEVLRDNTQYIESSHRVYCDDCYNEYVISCDICGIDIDTYYSDYQLDSDDQIYCEDCMRNLVTCELCGTVFYDEDNESGLCETCDEIVSENESAPKTLLYQLSFLSVDSCGQIYLGKFNHWTQQTIVVNEEPLIISSLWDYEHRYNAQTV